MVHIDGLGQRLKVSRGLAGLTQEDVANVIGVKPKTVSRYETSEINPSLLTIARLASLYRVSTDYLLGLDETANKLFEGLEADQIAVVNDMIAALKKANMKK